MNAERVVGYVLRRELEAFRRRSVRRLIHPIDISNTVEPRARVIDVVALLAEQPLVFVGDPTDPVAFITPSDLNTRPVRTHYFLLVSALEIGLAGLIRRGMNGDELRPLELLSPERRRRILGQFLAARHDGLEVDVVAHFNLVDLLTCVGRDVETRRLLGYNSRSDWDRQTSAFDSLRNAVVHGVRDLVDADRGPSSLLELERRIRETVSSTLSASRGELTLLCQSGTAFSSTGGCIRRRDRTRPDPGGACT